jgi:hypothetical protein
VQFIGPRARRSWYWRALRGAMRTGRVRAAVTIQSAASSADSAASSPSQARVGAIIGVATSGTGSFRATRRVEW